MNKKLLSTAVLAAIGVAGLGSAQAVYVNNDGLGEVLIYPFYSVEGGQDTYITIVNTTSDAKAVKVRFLEGMNSSEVLDFNLYLSPYDHWSAMVTESDSGGARITTVDQSCTVPTIVGRPGRTVDFRSFEYQSDLVERGLDRTREGYVEIIEMGVITNEDRSDRDAFNPRAWATHGADGVPADCAALVDAWRPGGEWRERNLLEVSPPTGGLYGYGTLINPADGVASSYDAVAFAEFWGGRIPNHSEPGSTDPSLEQGGFFAQVIDGNELYDLEFEDGLDALSATIMKASIANDYVLAPEINAATDWVVTFPTKRFYTNFAWVTDPTSPIFGAPNPTAVPVPGIARAPFTRHWDRRFARSCEVIDITYYDREERSVVGDVDFSPLPEGVDTVLCKEVNVVTFNGESPLYASDRIRADLGVEFDNGWMTMDFTGPGRSIEDFNETTVFQGLPVVGFAVQRYTNGDLNGLLSNYMALQTHKGQRSISSIAD